MPEQRSNPFGAMHEKMQGDIEGLIAHRGRMEPLNPLDMAMGFVGGAGVGAIKRMGGAKLRLVDTTKSSGSKFDMPGEQRFSILDETGDTIVTLETSVKGDLLSIDAMGVGEKIFREADLLRKNKFGGKHPEARTEAQSIGQSALREMLPELIQKHPGVKRIGGHRVTGARLASGAKARMEIPIPKRVQKKVEAGSRRDQGVLADMKKLELETKAAAKPEALDGAAVRVGDKTFVSSSHSMAYIKAQDELGRDVVDRALGARPRDFEGFMTTQGRFISRKEAVVVAERAKQLDTGVGKGASAGGPLRRPDEMGIEHMTQEEFSKMARKFYPDRDP